MKTRTLMWISAIVLSLTAVPAAADTWGLTLSLGLTSSGSAVIDDAVGADAPARGWNAKVTSSSMTNPASVSHIPGHISNGCLRQGRFTVDLAFHHRLAFLQKGLDEPSILL